MIGSSVCYGTGAAENHGWSWYLGKDYASAGWAVSNCSIGGQTTADILLRLEKDVISHHPDLFIVGLVLANEGLPDAKELEAGRMIQGVFEHNLISIKNALEKAGIDVMLGGVYPHNGYNPMQHRLLLDTCDRMSQWNVPVFQWLEQLDDGEGHFREGLYHDAGHPNDAGYHVMYETARKTLKSSNPL